MEKKVQSRGIVRQLTRVALSATVLTGSGWGIYQYQYGGGTDLAAVADNDSEMSHAGKQVSDTTAPEGRSAAEELKQLLGSVSISSGKQSSRSESGASESPAQLAAATATPSGNRYARYSADKRPLANSPPRVQLPASSNENPFSSVPPVVPSAGKSKPAPAPAPAPKPSGDRYGAAAGLLLASSVPSAPPASALEDSLPSVSEAVSAREPTIVTPPAAPSRSEVVTRGKEPANPLRTESPRPNAPSLSEKRPALAAAPQKPASMEHAKQASAASRETG